MQQEAGTGDEGNSRRTYCSRSTKESIQFNYNSKTAKSICFYNIRKYLYTVSYYMWILLGGKLSFPCISLKRGDLVFGQRPLRRLSEIYNCILQKIQYLILDTYLWFAAHRKFWCPGGILLQVKKQYQCVHRLLFYWCR